MSVSTCGSEEMRTLRELVENRIRAIVKNGVPPSYTRRWLEFDDLRKALRWLDEQEAHGAQ